MICFIGENSNSSFKFPGDSLIGGASPNSEGPIVSESNRIRFNFTPFLTWIWSAEFGGRLLQNNNCVAIEALRVFNKILFEIWV